MIVRWYAKQAWETRLNTGKVTVLSGQVSSDGKKEGLPGEPFNTILALTKSLNKQSTVEQTRDNSYNNLYHSMIHP